MVSFRWKFFVLGLITSFSLVAGSPSSAQYAPLSVPITLPSLVQGSTRIFVGTVTAVYVESEGTDMMVSLMVNHTFRGPYLPTTQVNLRFAFALAAPLYVGDRVLWFLPMDSPDGYSVPLGLTNGDFRIDNGGLALSLTFNRGLWDSEGELWDTGECSRGRFLDILDSRAMGGREMLKYLKWADSPYVPQPFPLSFMTAAVLSCLSSVEYQRYLDESDARSAAGFFE